MDIALLNKKVIQIMDEYSLNNVLQSAGLNGDYILRINNLADSCQKEIAQVKKIHAVYSISQNPLKPQNEDNFKLQQYRLTNTISYEAEGSQSYYFEVDKEAIILIEENIAGVYTLLTTINVPSGTHEFTAFKGLITPSDLTNNVRISFTGSYPYNIRNVALWSYTFPTAADVPDYAPYVKYQMPDNFFDLERVVQQTPRIQYADLGYYRWEGRKTFVLPYYYTGSFDIFYFRYPTTIDDTTPTTYVFEVDAEAQEAIPFYVAAHLLLTEPTAKAAGASTQLINEYQSKLANLSQYSYDGFMTIDNPSGW